jgi:hypothetical protein
MLARKGTGGFAEFLTSFEDFAISAKAGIDILRMVEGLIDELRGLRLQWEDFVGGSVRLREVLVDSSGIKLCSGWNRTGITRDVLIGWVWKVWSCAMLSKGNGKYFHVPPSLIFEVFGSWLILTWSHRFDIQRDGEVYHGNTSLYTGNWHPPMQRHVFVEEGANSQNMTRHKTPNWWKICKRNH